MRKPIAAFCYLFFSQDFEKKCNSKHAVGHDFNYIPTSIKYKSLFYNTLVFSNPTLFYFYNVNDLILTH